jgi:hypothetical protein
MSSKQLASAIEYDNAGTGLTSTNVQDAIDDVVSMAQAQEERMAGSVIVCKFATASLMIPSASIGSPAIVPHVFTANECGGTLPDASYAGALSRFKVCYDVLGAQVMNAGEPDGPGVVLRAGGGCTGPAELSAIFFKAK